MDKTPERIWADPPETFDGMDIWRSEPSGRSTEYIRADIVPQWQPIETAPKDGTHILVWFDHDSDPYYDGGKLTNYAAWADCGDFLDGRGHAIARWFPQFWEVVDEYGAGYWMPECWFALENDDFIRAVNPTHWMPLPAPPA